MAAIGTGNPTLLDQIKRTDPDSKIAQIVEALSENNPILMDATFKEGNLPTGERVTIRSGLPTVGFRMYNQGIAASKSSTIQVDESTALLEGRSEVDCELAKLNGNEAAFRASEDMAFLQSLNITAANTLFYGSTKTDPEKFHGFAPRFDALTADDNSANVIDAAFTSPDNADSSSIWFVTWGPNTCYMIYPKGVPAGIEHLDLGKDYVVDSGGTNKFLAYRSHFIWRLGLVVKDWRYVARVANIDASKYVATETKLITAMVKAYNQIKDFSSGRLVIYANRSTVNMLDQQVMNKANIWFSPVEWHGRKITGFRGIPIVTCDGLDATEALVA